jgi:hypothetical protein
MEGIRIVDLIFLGFCFLFFVFGFSSLLFLELLEEHPFLEESPDQFILGFRT